jgi:CrcB protein
MPGRAVDRGVTIALIATGGFVGATGRHAVEFVAPGPAGTLLVNVLGCFLLGTVLYVARGSELIADRVRVLLATGVLSSFTTYSTFAVEAFRADPPVMLATILATYATGLAAVVAGREVAASIVVETGGVRG